MSYLQNARMYLYDANWRFQLWWLPFFAWIFYYSSAYYLGQNIDKIRMKLEKYKWVVLVGSVIAGTLVVCLYLSNIIPPLGSKRIDILLYTVCICCLLFYIGSKMKKVTYIISLVSAYSFGNYCLHIFHIQVLHKIFKALPTQYQSIVNLSRYIIVLFIGSMFLSIVTVYLLNRFEFGAYVKGKIGVLYSNNQGNK